MGAVEIALLKSINFNEVLIINFYVASHVEFEEWFNVSCLPQVYRQSTNGCSLNANQSVWVSLRDLQGHSNPAQIDSVEA